MKRILILATAVLASFVGVAQSYIPVQVSGFTADVVANGSGTAISSTSIDVDGGGFVFVSSNFVNPSGQSPASALPNSGTISTAVTSTSGLTFQLAPYTGNNSLRISGTGSGTLTFNAPASADQVFVLATSGSGTSAVNITLNFTDGTSQAFTQTVADWFNGSGFAIQGISRVNRNNSGIENNTTNPRLYQYLLTLNAANISKQIQSIAFTKTSTAGVLNVMGVSLRSVASPSANDVGITAIAAPESGCGLGTQEAVTVTIHNFGSDAQSNIPVSYILNNGTPVTENFAGPLASNTSASFTFATTANLSSVGSYSFNSTTSLVADTVAANNSWSKTVVVSQTPATPMLSVAGPTSFCPGNWVTLSGSTSTNGAAYQWMLNGNPIAGATGAVFAANTAGSYAVKATANGCSSTLSAPVTLTNIPSPSAPFISTSDPTALCSGESVTLTATSAAAGASYLWLRDGTTISGATNSIYNTNQSGLYRALVVSGGCASTLSNTVNILVTQTPVTPTVSQSGLLLTSSSGVGNQWLKDGNPIAGATSGTYQVTASGTYSVIVSDGDCSSNASNEILVVVSGVETTLPELLVEVYPNPSAGEFSVDFNSAKEATIDVFDFAGRLVHQQHVTNQNNKLSLTGMAKGLYLIKISTRQGIITRKIVLE